MLQNEDLMTFKKVTRLYNDSSLKLIESIMNIKPDLSMRVMTTEVGKK